jgi:cell division protein YceG involved in septum cleavage
MKGKRNEKRSKKSAILKQHARNLFVGVVIVLFVSMSFSAFFVSAKEKDTPDHESTYIYYKSIKIEKGDTLWDIANENLPEKYSSTEEYVKVLKEINGLSSDKIYSGENLMIMYKYIKIILLLIIAIITE